MAYNSYDIKFYRLAHWNSPRWLRKQRFLILIKACLYPLVLIHNAFVQYRASKLYELGINYQVCYLEGFLNDRFDFGARRIYIELAQTQQNPYLYTRAETAPTFFYKRAEALPIVVYTRGESIGEFAYDFIVYIPVGVVFQEAEVRAMIAGNLSGKKYKIELF